MARNKLKPDQWLPGRDSAEVLFRSLVSVGTDGTHAEWIWTAVDEIEQLARRLRAFTVDELRKSLARKGVLEPDDPRAYGTAFREAARLGHIQNSGRTVPGQKRENVINPRTRPVAVWESLL